MARAAGFIGKAPLFHQIMAAGALGGGLLRIVAADTTVIRHHLVHRLIERDPVALLVSLQRVAFPARLESVMMAGTAAPRDLLVIDVGERYGCELADLEIRHRRAHQHEIGLIALEAGSVFDPFDLELAFMFMTAGALLRTVGIALELRRELAVASNTRLVRCQLEGRPVLLRLFAVAIAAGSLLAFYVDELLRRLVVDMVTDLALVLGRFDMTKVK